MDKNETLYEKYWKCRDYELERFWKNSTFVWTFLGLCFGAYGVLFMSKKEGLVMSDSIPYAIVFVSNLGLALSFIWLWMARASKAWFEVFENVIWQIDSVSQKDKNDDKYLIHNYWTIKREDKWYKPKNMFRSRPFSPSGIVIGIGWNLIIIWLFILIFSIVKKWSELNLGWLICTFLPIIMAILMRIFCVRSSTLRNVEQEKVYKNLKQDLPDTIKYFEVKKDYVFFFLNESTVSDSFQKLQKFFKAIDDKPECDGLTIKYSYDKIKKYYDNIDKNISSFKVKMQTKYPLIYRAKDSIALVSLQTICDEQIDEIKKNVNKNSDKIVLSNDKETITIPIDCFKDK